MAHYGKFENVKNYIAIVGNKNDQEKAGYYGEKIVLKCPELGLNTCWVAMTYGKSKAEIKRRIESCSNFDSISTYMVEVHKEERVKEEKISD